MARRGRKPGHPKTGGRAAGTPNKATATAREAISLLVDANVGKLQAWLDEIASTEGVRAAWDCFMSLVEFAVPKLQRTELRVSPPAFVGDPMVITDPADAARAYEQLMRGDLALDAVRFEPASGAVVAVQHAAALQPPQDGA